MKHILAQCSKCDNEFKVPVTQIQHRPINNTFTCKECKRDTEKVKEFIKDSIKANNVKNCVKLVDGEYQLIFNDKSSAFDAKISIQEQPVITLVISSRYCLWVRMNSEDYTNSNDE
jgi:hypothetical protein